MTEFEKWFTECIIFCADNYIGPDYYEWNLYSKEWRDRFDKGMTFEEAVFDEFKPN